MVCASTCCLLATIRYTPAPRPQLLAPPHLQYILASVNDKTVTIPMWAVLLICVQYAYTHVLTGQCCRPTFACSSKLGLSLGARSGLRMGARACCVRRLSPRARRTTPTQTCCFLTPVLNPTSRCCAFSHLPFLTLQGPPSATPSTALLKTPPSRSCSSPSPTCAVPVAEPPSHRGPRLTSPAPLPASIPSGTSSRWA